MSVIMSKLLETVLEDLETERDSRESSNNSGKSTTKTSKTKANDNKSRRRKKRIKRVSENGTATKGHYSNETTSEPAYTNNVSVDVHVPRADQLREHDDIGENDLDTDTGKCTGTHCGSSNIAERNGTRDSNAKFDTERSGPSKIPTREIANNNPSNGNVHNTVSEPNGEVKDNSKMDIHDFHRSFSRAHSAKSSSFYSTFSEPIFKPTSSRRKSTPQRPKTATGLTKRELDMFLPRKNFFNSHDKVLREAGYRVDSNELAKNKPNWRAILRMHTDDELYPERRVQHKDKPDVKERLRHVSQDTNEDDQVGHLNENVDTGMTVERDIHAARRRLKIGIKLLAANDRAEYKPLYEYLKYIHDNPEEYVSMARYSSENTDYKHPSVLVRTARVYSRGHNYDVPRSATIFTHAINNLKPKFIEPTRGDKGAEGAEQAGRGSGLEEGKTEMERMKIKTEKWMRGLTTQQLLRTKELALRDLGEEDINVTKWWTAFKSCNYLRVPPSMLEIG